MEPITATLFWLALNVYHEARGESFEHQVDVANVVLNRVRSHKYPDTVEDVITQGIEKGKYKCQFTWYCDGRSDEMGDEKAKKIAYHAAALAMSQEDTTGGAMFYYNPKKVQPYWANLKKVTKISGNHVLLK